MEVSCRGASAGAISAMIQSFAETVRKLMIDAPTAAKRFTPIFSLVADTCFGSEMIIVSIDETVPIRLTPTPTRC